MTSPSRWTILSALIGVLAAAESTPIIATRTNSTYAVNEAGQLTLIRQETGTWVRAADGSEATHMQEAKDGQPTGSLTMGLITSRGNNQTIAINYRTKQYLVQPAGPAPPPLQVKPGMESRVINGVYSVALPVRDRKTGEVTGKGWFSPDYKITTRNEFDVTIPASGKKIHIVDELSNVQVGVAPDAQQFAIPSGFSRAAGTVPCSNCASQGTP